MISAIGESLPMSVGVALSPLPVAAVMIMLLTAQAKTNGPAFLTGWVAGILAVATVVFLMPGLETARGDPTRLSGLIRLMLGLVLLFLAVRQWRQRPAPDAPVEVPKVLARLDDMGMTQSAMTGFLLSGVNPKNLFLNAAGAATIDASMLAPGPQMTALLVFTLVASLTVALPVISHFLFRPGAEAMFGQWKAWLISNNVTVLAALLLVFGTLLIGDGLTIVAT